MAQAESKCVSAHTACCKEFVDPEINIAVNRFCNIKSAIKGHLIEIDHSRKSVAVVGVYDSRIAVETDLADRDVREAGLGGVILLCICNLEDVPIVSSGAVLMSINSRL